MTEDGKPQVLNVAHLDLFKLRKGAVELRFVSREPGTACRCSRGLRPCREKLDFHATFTQIPQVPVPVAAIPVADDTTPDAAPAQDAAAPAPAQDAAAPDAAQAPSAAPALDAAPVPDAAPAPVAPAPAVPAPAADVTATADAAASAPVPTLDASAQVPANAAIPSDATIAPDAASTPSVAAPEGLPSEAPDAIAEPHSWNAVAVLPDRKYHASIAAQATGEKAKDGGVSRPVSCV